MKILYVGEGTYAETLQPMKPSFKSFFPQRRAHLHEELEKLGHTIEILTVPDPDKVRTITGLDKYDVVYTDNPRIGTSMPRLDVFDFCDWYSDMYAEEYGEDYNYYHLKSAERNCATKAKAVVAQGVPIADYVSPYNGNVTIIPNGVDPERFYPEVPYKHDAFRVVYTGKLTKWYKRILTICESVARLGNEYELYVIGDGVLADDVKTYEEFFKNIHFIGPVPYEKVPTYTRKGDVCVFPVDDDSPIAVYEYMACGKPMILRGERMKSFLKSRTNALFVEGYSPYSWANALKTLKENDVLRENMGKANLAESKKYHWSVLGKKLEEVMIQCATS